MRKLCLEMHCHTIFSHDGYNSFEAIVAAMRRRCIDAVCITDHDTIEGAIAFSQYVRKRDLDIAVVCGVERTLTDGSHIIGLLLKEPIVSNSYLDFLEEAKQQDAVVVLPHPFRRDGVLEVRKVANDTLPKERVAIEIFNPKCSYQQNRLAMGHVAHHHWVGVGGSDAHYPGEIGECVVVTDVGESLEESVRNAVGGKVMCEVYGVFQDHSSEGRKYLPLYYKAKRFVRPPQFVLPALKSFYRRYKAVTGLRRKIPLERKGLL